MNTRERFLKVMNWSKPDRVPNMDFGYWDETIARWKSEGLPTQIKKSEDLETHFGLEGYELIPALPVKNGLFPEFEEKVLDRKGPYLIIQNREGNICKIKEGAQSIPEFISFGLKTREDWERYKEERLDFKNTKRIGNVKECANRWRSQGLPIRFKAGSFYGWLRNWMGLEKFSITLLTDREWIEEMMDHLAELTLNLIEKALLDAKPDMACWWEDMCYKQGPLLSPTLFEEIIVPRYKRITLALKRHGILLNLLDCDGRIDDLVPGWLDAGINCLLPIEAAHTDPVKLRQAYPKDLLMIGGVDKKALIKGKEAIDLEMKKLKPIVSQGGYIPTCDHRVPPDVSLENYIYYLDKKKEIL